MTKAIRIHENGPPSVMRWEEVAVGDPGKGEVRLKHTAIGLNFIDTYHRAGLYPMQLPMTLGMEGAGVVEAVGRGVKGFKTGDRVTYAAAPLGSYSEARLMPVDKLVKIPAGITDEQAASMMLKGMTACYLATRTFKVKKGDTILVHAAAGGVGLILCQWAKALGAKVIGTVGSEEKARLARKHGCHYPIIYTRENFVERVKQITRGKGVPVVYDSVGKETFPGSLDCLERRGLFVSFGNASGPVPAFPLLTLTQKGSLFATRPSLPDYTATRDDLDKISRALFAMVKSKKVKIEINQRYALADAAQAHIDLESRKTTGSTILVP